MATSGFTINGSDIASAWVDKSYLITRYPELVDLLKQAGLWGWGQNSLNLGTNNTTPYSSPVQTVAGGSNWRSAVTNSFGTSAGIKTDGTLWTWGNASSGGLGDNTLVGKSSPIQTIASGTNWKQVATGPGGFTTIKTDGTLWIWGLNNNGQLGDNTATSKSSPVQTVSGGTNWKLTSMGQYYTAGLKTDGTLWLWGRNDYGQLGDNTTTKRSSPVQTIAGGGNWKSISCGIGNFSAAIKTDGTLWLWGKNYYGQMGVSNAFTSSPVQTISSGSNWKTVGVGFGHTIAIKTDNSLWTWGLNTSGQLGNNTRTNTSSPIQTIAGGTNWYSVSLACYNSSAAIKTDGTLWVWGDNTGGALGDNTITPKSSPVQTISGGTNWKTINNGDNDMLAIRDDSLDPL